MCNAQSPTSARVKTDVIGQAYRSSLVAILVFLCGLMDSGSAIFAQTSTELIGKNQRASYFTIKEAMNADRRATWTGGDGYPAKLPLRGCTSGSTVFVVRGPIRKSMVELAYMVLIARSALVKHKFPREIWEDRLMKLEEAGLHLLATFKSEESFDTETYRLMDNFAASINQAAKSQKLRLLEVIGNPECGGPPIEYKISVAPTNGEVFIIPTFFYIVCEKQNLNPIDPKCDNWFPPLRHGEHQMLGGNYKYRIRSNETFGEVKDIDTDRYAKSQAITFK